VFLVPGGIPADVYVVDGRLFDLVSLAINWNSKPLKPMRGFNLVAISPATPIKLHVIIKHEDVGFLDLMKISTPWDIRRL
jgi:hypothetical protein